MTMMKKIAVVAALAVSVGTFAESASALPMNGATVVATDHAQAGTALPLEHVQYYGYGYPGYGYGYGPRFYGYYGRGFYGRGYYGRGYGRGFYGRGGEPRQTTPRFRGPAAEPAPRNRSHQVRRPRAPRPRRRVRATAAPARP